MPPHYQGKGANQRRPQHEGVACGFGPSFHNPRWIGPSLYMWLLWLEPLPALQNENIPEISNVDL